MTGPPSQTTVAATELTAEDLSKLWVELAEPDAAKAFVSMCRLIRAPDQSVPFLRTQLLPIPRIAPDRLALLIRDLDSEEFAVRNRASQQLGLMADSAEPALEAALHAKPSPEVRRRIGELLEVVRSPVPTRDQLRAVRSLEVLERIDSDATRRLLAVVAEGAPGARLTREAKASLLRLTLLHENAVRSGR